MIGQTVSHYRILSRLGAGGMGVVYQAEDTRLKRTVALKFLPADLTRDDAAKTRFIHEARAASALQHHNICTIHEIDQTADGQLFIAMDCYAGETLKERIARGPLPVDEAVDIACQVAAGLSKAHAAGMVHRDLKPANIMVTSDGVVKILDFGLAKLAGSTKVTKTGMTVGTVAYMSPEQARGEAVDARSDIWSLGVVLYEMLTGKVPFPGDHEAAVLYGIINNEPKPLQHDLALQSVIDRALAKDPAARYASVTELRADLGAGSGATRSRASRRGKRRLLVTMAIAVALAVFASGLVTNWWRPGSVPAANALAVMDFNDLSNTDDHLVSASITELVKIGLIETDVVRVVSSDLLHDLRRRSFGSTRGAIEAGQTIEIARKAGATLFLTGTIQQSGGRTLLTWHLVDAENGYDIKAGRVEGNQLASVADQVIAGALPVIARRCGARALEPPVAVETLTTASPRAYQHFVAGTMAAEEYARADDAIAEFEAAVAEDSTFALAYMWLGRMYWGGFGYQDPQKARGYVEVSWRLRSRLGIKERMLLEAQRQDLDGRVGEAISTLRETHNRWPDDRQVACDLASGLYWRWYFAEAVKVHEEVRRMYPDDMIIGGPTYAQSLLALGRTEEALRATRAYLMRWPREPNAWDELGLRYLAIGLPDSAEIAFRHAVELEPTWVPENSARCAYHRGDLKGAISLLKRILEDGGLSENRRKTLQLSNRFQIYLGALYIESGRFGDARAVCGRYTESSDHRVAELLLKMGDTQVALEYARQLTEMGGGKRGMVGRALLSSGDMEGARKEAQALLDAEFELGARARYEALRIQAEAALAEHDPDAALEILARIKENCIFIGGFVDIDYRTDLAAAYRMAGRLEEAAAVHVELLRIYGGHAISHYELGKIYEEMKRPADARKEYAKFLEMWADADEGLPQLVDARERFKRL